MAVNWCVNSPREGSSSHPHCVHEVREGKVLMARDGPAVPDREVDVVPGIEWEICHYTAVVTMYLSVWCDSVPGWEFWQESGQAVGRRRFSCLRATWWEPFSPRQAPSAPQRGWPSWRSSSWKTQTHRLRPPWSIQEPPAKKNQMHSSQYNIQYLLSQKQSESSVFPHTLHTGPL